MSGGEAGLGVGDAVVGGPLVGHGQQPADPARDGVLGHRRLGQLAELLERGLLVLQAQLAGLAQVVGDVLAEDLQGPLDPGAGGDRRARRAAQVGVVEVGQPVGGGPHLAAHAALLPGQHGVVGAEPGEHRADGVAVADDDPVDPAHLAGLGRDAQPAGRADQREGRLGPGAGDLEGRRPAGLGERAVGEERAAPGGLGVAHRAADDLGRQPAHRAAAAVDQAGLAGQRLAVLDDPHDVAAALAQPAGREHEDLGGVAVDLGELASQPARGVAPVSSSASTTMRPPMMCSPPANLSVAATSALRQQGLVTTCLLSSSFTFAVIAMAVILPRVTRAGLGVATNVPQRGREAQRVVLAGPVAATHRSDEQASPRAGRTARARAGSSSTTRGVGEHRVEAQVRCAASTNVSRWRPALKPAVSPVPGSRLSTSRRRARVDLERLAQLGHEQVRHHRGEPRAGAEHDPVGAADGGHRLRVGRRVGRHEAHRTDRARGDRDLRLAADDAARHPGRSGSSPVTSASMVSGTAAIGSTRPWRLEQPADEVEPRDGVVVQLPERDDEQVAERVPAERAVAGEAVLQHVAPGLAPLALAAQRRQRHPQVAGGQHAELVAQPAATSRRRRRP